MPKNHCSEMSAQFSKSGNTINFLLFPSGGIFFFSKSVRVNNDQCTERAFPSDVLY